MSDSTRGYCVQWWTTSGDYKSINCTGEAEAAHILGEIGSHLHHCVSAQLTREELEELKQHAPDKPFGFRPFQSEGRA